MATYRMTYGDQGENILTETLEGVEIEREDGWVVIFRGKTAIQRLREEHVHSLEQVPARDPD